MIYLPNTTDTCGTAHCFKSGDPRTSENLGLTGIHMVFLREHNRIAKKLATVKPTWSDEALYQETRRIMIAILQHIVYSQFVPSIISLEQSGLFGIVPTGVTTATVTRPATTSYFTGHNPNVSKETQSDLSTTSSQRCVIDHLYLVKPFSNALPKISSLPIKAVGLNSDNFRLSMTLWIGWTYFDALFFPAFFN